MHKARVKANNYYFAELHNMYGIEREINNEGRDKLYFLLSNSTVKTCASSENRSDSSIMSNETIKQGLEYAKNNFLRPVFIHSNYGINLNFKEIDLKGHNIFHYCSVRDQDSIRKITNNYILTIEYPNDEGFVRNMKLEENIILNISSKFLSDIENFVTKLFNKTNRINLNILDNDKQFNYTLYEKQLMSISDYIYYEYLNKGIIKELNVITDELFMEEKKIM